MENPNTDLLNTELLRGEMLRTIDAEAKAVAELRNSLDMPAMAAVAGLIVRTTGRIILSGCGTSAMAARKIAHSLCCIERPALFLSPADAVHGGLGVLQEGDLLILISKGGNTRELVNLIPACKSKKAVLIGVSENSESEIARRADYFLQVKVAAEPDPFNMLATASTMAVIAAFDAICVALMAVTGYTKEQFAVIHPGGAVGERLHTNTE